MFKTLAREFGLKYHHKLRSPGFIETDMTKSLEENYKEEIACRFLFRDSVDQKKLLI